MYYILAPAEASSNLSRFDGVKFGHRAKDFADLNDMYKKTRAEGFGDEVKRRIMIGAYVLSEGYYDAYYLQAQKIRRMIADDFQAAFKECDVIAGPAAPTTAWAIGGKADPCPTTWLTCSPCLHRWRVCPACPCPPVLAKAACPWVCS